MNKQIGILVAGILIIVLVIGIILFGLNQNTTTQVITPNPSPTNAQTPTPAGDELEVTGEVTEISDVGFQNATVLTVDGINVYVVNDTQIQDSGGQSATVDDIEVGTSLAASGVPQEGGIQATEITIFSSGTSPSPTRTATPTPTPVD